MAPKRAAAGDPFSSTEEYGDTSSSDSTTFHEQEVSDNEREEKESEEEEPESGSEEEEWAAAEEEENEESTEEGDEEEVEPDPQPSSKRIDPPLTAPLKEEEDVDFQPIQRIDYRAPLLPEEAEEPAAKNQPQSNKPTARGRKRASGEIDKSPSPGVRPKSAKTTQHSDSTQPKSKRIRRVWAPGDEVVILVALARHRRQHGELPAWGDFDFFESIRERLEDNSCDRSDIKDKARSLLRRYKSGVVSTTDHDKRLHNLSKDVLGDLPSTGAATGSINGNKQADGSKSGAKNGGRQSDTKGFKEMCEMYPLLSQEVKLLAEVQPGFESSFTRLDAKNALDIEKKLEKVKYAELKIEAQMVLEVHAPKAKISKKLVSLLAKVSKNA